MTATDERLAIYLNDHLAGSVVAIGLMESIERTYAGTEIEEIVAGVRQEVEEDRAVLEALLSTLREGESTTRKVAGWFTERLAQLKLAYDDGERGTLRLLESAEMISLGIEGKKGLWRALSIGTDLVPQLRVLGFQELIDRAESQRERIETIRLGAARAAFAPA